MRKTWFENAAEKLKSLKLPPHSSGHHLITKVPTCYSNETVGEVLAHLTKDMKHFDSINYVYVLTKNDTLAGVFSLKHLYRADPTEKITKLMVTPVITSQPQVHHKRVARQALKHNLKAIPIVDKKNDFLGVLSSDHIHKVLYQEYRHELLHTAGIMVYQGQTEDTLSSPVIKSFLRRVPWILIGIIGGIIVARIIGVFEAVLETNLVLATFIPLIVYIGSAVGNQTQILFIRDLAFYSKIPFLKYAFKHAIITLLIALTAGLFTSAIIAIFWGEIYLSLVVGVASIVTITSSVFTSMIVPYVFYVTDKDPATGTGPFATILQDVTSTVIYFLVAMAML